MTKKTGSEQEPQDGQQPTGGVTVGLDKMGEPIIDPAPDRPPPEPDSPTFKAVKKGAKWGSLAGLVIGQLYLSHNSINTPVGTIYTGNVALVLIGWVALGTAIGTGIGWLSVQKIGEDDDRSPPSFPSEPYG
jgi:hypothetical protein